MPSSDPNLVRRQDAQLRDVAVPGKLLRRLRQIALMDDEGLDEALGAVALPSGLVASLRGTVLAEDDGLDAAIREIRAPVELSARLRQARMNWTRLTRWATAVSLVIAIGLSYVGAMVVLLVATYSDDAQHVDLTTVATPEPSPWIDDTAFPFGPGIEPHADNTGPPRTDRLEPIPKIELVDLGQPDPPAAEPSEPWREDAFLEPERRGLDPDVLGSPNFDELPELERLAGPSPRGVDPPMVPGFDWPFYARYNIYPFVSPAAHPRLRSAIVPLDVDSASFELMRRYLADSEVPLPKDIWIEEFLAALDYGFAEPTSQALGLSVAGGPSPFGEPGTLLLQVGVQGRRLQEEPRRPVHLVLTVDVSASMRWGGRLEMTRRALGKLARQMGPDDRFSLVAFGEKAQVVVEDVRQHEADQLVEGVGWLSLQGSTNLSAGLLRAYGVAGRVSVSDRTAVRVVLLTDGLTELGQRTTELLERRLTAAAGQGTLLEVLDLRPEEKADPQLDDFARVGGGRVHRAANTEQIGWALREIITDQSQLIAHQARLKVTFDPENVVAYRLLGHEGKSMQGLVPSNPEADFRSGQSASALYEIILKPTDGKKKSSAEHKGVATVELTWRKLGDEAPHRQKQTREVGRGLFSSSFVDAPLSVQEAALVAEMAEVLRNSPFGLQRGSSRVKALGRIRELAAQVDSRLHERPTFVEFTTLLDAAIRAKPHRSGAQE